MSVVAHMICASLIYGELEGESKTMMWRQRQVRPVYIQE